mgnify:CR=1 FL=1
MHVPLKARVFRSTQDTRNSAWRIKHTLLTLQILYWRLDVIYIVGFSSSSGAKTLGKREVISSSSLTHPDWSKLVRGDRGIPGPAGAPGPHGPQVLDSSVNITKLPSYSVCPGRLPGSFWKCKVFFHGSHMYLNNPVQSAESNNHCQLNALLLLMT